VRKNLGTGNFEAYRQFMQKYHSDNMKIMDTPVDFTTQIDTGLSEIAFTGSFDQCLQYVTKEHNTHLENRISGMDPSSFFTIALRYNASVKSITLENGV